MPEGGENLGVVQEPSEDIGEASEPLEDSSEDSSVEDDSGPESVRETVERVFREASEKPEEEAAESNEATQRDEKGRFVKKDKAQKIQPAQPQQKVIEPPGRFNAQQKEVFNQLPPELQDAYASMVNQQEGKFTTAMQSAVKREKEAAHIVETVRPYFLSHPELMEAGYTEAKFISSLVAAHHKLVDPATARQAYIQLGKDIGLNPKFDEAEAQGGQVFDIEQHPKFRAIQERLNRIESKDKTVEQQRFDGIVSGVVAEMAAVRDTKDANGRYLYPELHDPGVLERAKPLVSALVGTVSGLSYGDALRQAVQIMRGQPGNSGQQMPSRLPADNGNRASRAASAAVSVRGQSAPQTVAETAEIPEEALGSARDSVRWALNQLRGGK